MRSILPQMSAVRKLWPEADPTEGAYRPTLYSLCVPCEDGVLLYHTLTGELLHLSAEEAGQKESDGRLRAELTKKHFLVREDFDEYSVSRQIRRIAEMMTPPEKRIKSFTVFTTTDCNARCPYCYELGRPRRPMSEQTAHDAADYIVRAGEGKMVTLQWFGGEPLYNPGAIGIITGELCARGVPFRSVMVTNGYLFDAQTVQKAKRDWALERVQITLDGTEEQYNKIKRFLHAEGSAYRRVLENIGLLLDADIKVSIRMNASRDNMEDLCRLTDELAERFRGQKKISLYSVLLRDFTEDGTHPETEAEALAMWDALQSRILSSRLGGLKPLPRKMQTNGCMADSDGSVTILPDGRLGKCEHESEQLLVGSIYEGVTDTECAARWKARVEVPQCRTCVLSPMCIRLRLCAWTGDRCTDGDRARMRIILKQMILYENYRASLFGESKGEETDETETDADFSGFGR
ncbi:MAG: radical SAM protein [Clostridia bacterium]|nr:radical SAM protein [Clostridia bacterium]